MNIKRHSVISDFFVGELPYEMPRDSPAELPPKFRCKRADVIEEFAARDVRRMIEEPLAIRERLAYILLKFVLQRIGAENKCATEISFPLLKTGPRSKNRMSSSPIIRSGGFSA